MIPTLQNHLKKLNEQKQDGNICQQKLKNSFMKLIFKYIIIEKQAQNEQINQESVDNFKTRFDLRDRFWDRFFTSDFKLEKVKKKACHFPKSAFIDSKQQLSLPQFSCPIQQQVQLPNHKHFQLSRLFYEGWKVNFNQSDLPFSVFEQVQHAERHALERALCAIANEARGILLIGVSKDLQVKGLQVNVEIMRTKIKQAISKIFPRYNQRSFRIDQIPVFKSYYYKNRLGSSNPQTSKYVVRVMMQAVENRKLKILVYEKKNCPKSYQFTTLVGTTPVLGKQQQFYRSMHKKFIKSRYIKKVNLENIYLPEPLFFLHPNNSEEKSDFHQMPEMEDYFRFKNSSILNLSSKKKEALLKRIFQKLTQNHVKYEKSQPFNFLSKNSEQQIWFISHQDSFESIEKIKMQIDSTGKIPFFSVQKHITLKTKYEQVQSNEILKNLKIAFKKYFQKKFRIKWLIQSKEGKSQFLGLIFDSFNQSLFAFVFIMSSNGWAKFYKQSEVNKYCTAAHEYQW